MVCLLHLPNIKLIMKRNILVAIIAVFAFSPMLKAQDLEIHAYTGWMFGFSANYNYYNSNSGKLKNVDAQDYGLALNYRLQDIVMLEISYNRMDSYFEDRGGWLNETRNSIAVTTEYYQIGGLKELADGKARPYGLFTLGAVRYHPKTSGFSDSWKFALNFGLGAKVYLGQNERIALRVQGKLMMPINWAGFGVSCGGGGCGSGVTLGSTIVEGDLTAGLVVVLK